jgi:hypothetical protein
VEVKPGEEVVSVNVGWTVEKYVEVESGKRKDVNGRKPALAKASANGRGKKSAVKTSAPKKSSSKAAKKSSAKGKKGKGKK